MCTDPCVSESTQTWRWLEEVWRAAWAALWSDSHPEWHDRSRLSLWSAPYTPGPPLTGRWLTPAPWGTSGSERERNICHTRLEYVKDLMTVLPVKTSSWKLHLDELVDVGWVTRCEAAEDYQDLSARVSWHVPSNRDRCTLSHIYRWKETKPRLRHEQSLLQCLHGQVQRVVEGRLSSTHGVHSLLQSCYVLLWITWCWTKRCHHTTNFVHIYYCMYILKDRRPIEQMEGQSF